MVQLPDALGVLLPAADESCLARARTVVQFLRLISDDARSARAGAVSVGIEPARSELERQDRRRVEAAIDDLLRHHLSALATPDTFLWWGDPSLGHGAAWRVLDEFRDDMPWLAELPEPAEPPATVAGRLLRCREQLGSDSGETLAWRARVLRFTEGPRAAEGILRGVASSGSAADRAAQRASIAVLVECLLDRGAVREARALLQATAAVSELDLRLRQLLAWTLLCLGDFSGAKSAQVGLPPWPGTLPASLIEMRAHRPEWLPCLAGRAVQLGPRHLRESPDAAPMRDRSRWGAAFLGVFAFDPRCGPDPLHLDAAPALRARIPDWLRDRDGSCTVAGQREHELIVTARPVVAYREGERPIDGALGREGTMALALAPAFDEDGEVTGWLYAEFEHQRLPSLAVLAEGAASWSRGFVARRGGDARPKRSVRFESSPDAWGSASRASGTACVAALESLVSELGIKTAQRRWWGFGIEGGDLQLLATGGEGTGLANEHGGRGRALTRALATSGRVSFEEPDLRLSIDPKSGSGLVLPISAGGILCGILAIESSRRRDFREADIERFAETSRRAGLALRLAQFVDWHRERFGHEVWFDPDRPEFRQFALDFLAAARSRCPVVLTGSPGSGKTILARWLHFESRTDDGPIRVVHCGSQPESSGVLEWMRSAAGGTLILEDLERSGPAIQEELLRILERDEGPAGVELADARLVATARVDLQRAAGEGKLRDDLAHRLDRLQFRVPALRDRREDILPLAECIAGRLAREENVLAPAFSDEALALLWRQPWNGNVRELESLIYKLVLLGRARGGRAVDPVGPLQVLEIAARFSLQIVQRLPSRHPLRGDLLAALRATRKPGGRLNKTRAALYLGWDPDTLVARMQDAGIGETVEDETAWVTPSAGVPPDPEPAPG